MLVAPFREKGPQESSVAGDHLSLEGVLSQSSGQIGRTGGAQSRCMALVGHLRDGLLSAPVLRWLADVRERPVRLCVVLLHQLLYCLHGNIRLRSRVLAVSYDNAHHTLVLFLYFIGQINALVNGVKEGCPTTGVVVGRTKWLYFI